ncbi:MAG: YifB family Mg chelatase-like AAA ATPase [Chthoniobacterales bacterium]|nr:YifB family Mg chelatase-like AAA ATPase [Chthoniobacterales bacterium]
MLSRLFSAAILGVDALEVEIEVNIAEGGNEFRFRIVGLPDASVRESIYRVTTALSNSGFRWPNSAVTANLAPADLKKEGPGFDLPIALGFIAAAQRSEIPRFARCIVAGELALDGSVRPIKGALPIALEARARGKKAVILPIANATEAAMVSGIEVYGVRSLREAFDFLSKKISLTPVQANPDDFFASHSHHDVDFSEVRGQLNVRRAVEIAVAGGHNLLLIGPPGSGKSMIAKRIPSILPPLTLEEAIETTKIHSVCGLLSPDEPFVSRRPFRAPHHTISDVGLIGGSTNPTPGEVSLAHNGVLFLDELPEFKRSALEALRVPLEDHRAVITRASGTVTFPADFMLVAAMNPCPCGNFGNPNANCRCSTSEVAKYRNKISGPLLDRIDIHIEAPAVEFHHLSSTTPAESSATIRQRVIAARQIQANRFASQRHSCNARMSKRSIQQFCTISSPCSKLLQNAMRELNFSARAYDRILKVARTIADLDNSDQISENHLYEALQYRTLDRSLWNA